MKLFIESLGNYRTTVFGLASAVLTFLIANHVGPIGIEQTLLSLSLLLSGAAAADAAKK
jgi:hypothetical protein